MRLTRLEAAVLLLLGGLIGHRLLVPPLVGMADSWDFERVLRQSGLAHAASTPGEQYFAYFDPQYRIVPRSPAPAQSLYAYKTSTLLAVRLARGVALRAGARLLDLRVLGVLYAAVYLLGVWVLLAAARPLGRAAWLVLAGAVLLVLGDVGYVAYFNSFYSEGTALAMLPLAFGCAAFLPRDSGRTDLALLGYFAALALVVTAKPAYVTVAPAFALFGIYLARERGLRAFRKAVALALALVALAGWYSRQHPPLFVVHSAYIGIFMDLLPHSSTRARDLTELGLLPGDAALSGTTPFMAGSPLNDPTFRARFEGTVSSLSLVRFYLRHPGRLLGLVARGTRHAFDTRVARLGYYAVGAGRGPLAQPFGLWSVARERLVPRSLTFLSLYFASGGVALALLRARRVAVRAAGACYALLVFVAAAQLAGALLLGGGEPDLEKHLFLFDLAFDWSLVLLAVSVAAAWLPSPGRARGAAQPGGGVPEPPAPA